VVVGEFLHREEIAGGAVEENRVIGDARGFELGGEFRPDFVVAFFVLGFEAGLEFHHEGVAFHGVSWRRWVIRGVHDASGGAAGQLSRGGRCAQENSRRGGRLCQGVSGSGKRD
jgi:hypothetical protein